MVKETPGQGNVVCFAGGAVLSPGWFAAVASVAAVLVVGARQLQGIGGKTNWLNGSTFFDLSSGMGHYPLCRDLGEQRVRSFLVRNGVLKSREL